MMNMKFIMMNMKMSHVSLVSVILMAPSTVMLQMGNVGARKVMPDHFATKVNISLKAIFPYLIIL